MMPKRGRNSQILIDHDNTDDDELKSSRGHKQQEATADTAKTFPQQSTYVVGTSQVTSDSGTSRRRLISDTAVVEQVSQVKEKEASTDLIIDSVDEVEKLYQALEIKGNIHKVHYKDPRLLLEDEIAARKLFESEFPGEDIEQILQEQKLYLSQSKSEKSKTGRKGKRRTSNVS